VFDSEVAAQIECAPHHRDTRHIGYGDHQRQDETCGDADPPVKRDVSGCDQPALIQKNDEP
jgi:hypothetical protein